MGEARQVRHAWGIVRRSLLIPVRSYERAILNERPIYLFSYFIALAVVQSVAHLYFDYDQVFVPVAKRTAGAADQRTHPVKPVAKTIQLAIPQILVDGITKNAVVSVACPFLYTLFFRRTAWSFTMYFARLVWDFPRSAAEPPGAMPPTRPGLLYRAFSSGAMLVFCWQTASLCFSTFIGKEPLKRAQVLTAEAKDPNGSLLDGLKARKEVVKTFAFWELSLISQSAPDRRKAIFNDIDREGGPTWSQILDCATDLIQGISVRIDEKTKPSPTPNGSGETKSSQPVVQTLPRLTDPPKESNVFASSPKAASRHGRFGEALSSTAKSYGQSPDWTPKARARARDVFDRASAVVLSPERKQKLVGASKEPKLLTGPSAKQPKDIHPLIAQVLRSPFGQPLQRTYAQRLSSIVLGTPHAALCPLVDAVEALTRLLVASLGEDQYGKVQADVPDIVRLFTGTILTLEAFIQNGLDIHWTDVNFPPSSNPDAQAEARRVRDVELVLNAFKTSLADLLSAFKMYFRDIGLGGKDLRLAREAAGVEEEVGQEVRRDTT